MAGEPETPRLERVAQRLASNGVEFIVIGGQAEVLYGSSRITRDVDLCYRRIADNLERLARVLRELNPSLRGAPPDLPFIIDAKSLALGENFTFRTDIGDLDLLGYVEPIGGYEELLRNAETYRVGELDLKVISLDDLIRVREHLGRPVDRESLLHLRAIKQVRKEMGA